MMHQLTDRKKNYLLYFFIFIFLSTTNNLSLLKNFELFSNIQNIKVEGLRDDLNLKIKKNLNFLLNENIFFLNKELLINELKKLNYIQSYKVSKNYPSTVVINIKQTDLLAITVNNNNKYIIGSNGKLIDHEIFNSNINLPNFFGKFSSKDFVFFINIIKQTNFNYNEITDIFFFQSGRWDIKTINDQTIKLPKENLKKAFIKAAKIIKNNNLNHKLIDLRIPNQVILMNG
tara:strand:+ start:16 stop:708 length:693 start_codon:yes stop_codon:yes gene_type:complete